MQGSVVVGMAMALFAGSALAEPPQALVDALRQENPNTRALLRDAAEFCKEAVLPSASDREQTKCADKSVIAEGNITSQAVKDAWKEAGSARFIAIISGRVSLQEGREKAGKAIPLFLDFLSALAQAEKPAPAAKKPAKKA